MFTGNYLRLLYYYFYPIPFDFSIKSINNSSYKSFNKMQIFVYIMFVSLDVC
jgi:hypothetical protein